MRPRTRTKLLGVERPHFYRLKNDDWWGAYWNERTPEGVWYAFRSTHGPSKAEVVKTITEWWQDGPTPIPRHIQP